MYYLSFNPSQRKKTTTLSESLLNLIDSHTPTPPSLRSRGKALARRFSPACDSLPFTSASRVTPTPLFVPGPAELSELSHAPLCLDLSQSKTMLPVHLLDWIP